MHDNTATCLLLIPVLFLFACRLSAQDDGSSRDTLKEERIETGNFSLPVIKFVRMADQWGVMFGGEGTLKSGKHLTWSYGAYMLSSSSVTAGNPSGVVYFSYAGVSLYYLRHFSSSLHAAAGGLLGCGGANVSMTSREEGEGFIIAEPGGTIELDLTSFLRIGVGGSYRFVNGIDLPGLTDRDFSGPSATIALRFGSY